MIKGKKSAISKHAISLLAGFILMSSCQTKIFGPNVGSITGNITDMHGREIQGAVVTATNIAANMEEKSASAVSDHNGEFHIENILLTESQISIEAPGFERYYHYESLSQKHPKKHLQIQLVGSPYIEFAKLNTNSFTESTIESLELTCYATDDYNSDLSLGNMEVIVKDEASLIVKDVIITTDGKGDLANFIFTTSIQTNVYNEGNYELQIRVKDSDGNVSNRITTGFNIK